MEPKPINSIRHLSVFLQKVAQDHRIKPTHVGLYMGLFQQWALCHFLNPFSLVRNKAMGVAKITSRVTYHKCIRELHSWGYIHYDPSYDYYKGSSVYMFHFR